MKESNDSPTRLQGLAAKITEIDPHAKVHSNSFVKKPATPLNISCPAKNYHFPLVFVWRRNAQLEDPLIKPTTPLNSTGMRIIPRGPSWWRAGLPAILWVCIGSASLCFGQQSSPPALAEVKAAAEHGDAKAQDKLGDAYSGWTDNTNALVWYRKAAEQGVANSQYNLGRILMGKGITLGKVSSADLTDEAIRWYLKAASQDNKPAQMALAQLYEDGPVLRQDYAEAYKWYTLAHRRIGLEVVAKVYLDRLVLKMSQEQITDGQQRVEKYLTAPGAAVEMPELSFVGKLKLSGISGPVNHRLAMINNHTFEAGEEGQIKIEGRVVKIRCLEIRPDSVLIKAESVEKVKELRIR